ncbi:uncharacterized protein EV420DRAFT_1635847 [Desarmillaria tabescens]|uniref:CxC2-like cysteine cluster KDZ transposase-associated domain-containing protein n=1 Tax=Armillaria tabescens TaxID=1929756 RepID=A0AA39NJH8_ARMTA|nr:uncharacterized protein EV420DRAFT_1635847 [Desarmillaria tabescens]KAK0466807.1 hypothetical protein EV420DRAFT_1635847 [Desarmillaria tabescens]
MVLRSKRKTATLTQRKRIKQWIPGASTEDAEVHQDDPHFQDWLPAHMGVSSKRCFWMNTLGSLGSHVLGVKLLQRKSPSTDVPPATNVSCTATSEWTGTFFKRTTLGVLGLVMALGHDPDTCCPTPLRGQLHVLDLEGIQTVHVDYCDCMQSLPHGDDISDAGSIPPAVVYVERTCQPPSQFQAFMRMVREWRYLKLLKRMLDKSPRDLKGLTPGKLPIPVGSLAVKCPACPWPGINLEEGWENDTMNLWKYISNAARDPSLVNGAGFVVAQESFRKHVAEYGKCIPYDPSDCRDHQAVKLVTSKHGAGLAMSRVATVDCARHDAKGPGAVTILDHSEEQVWMDYIFCSRMQQSTLQHIVVSYDINCQWSKKLWERIAIYPSSMTPHQDPGDFVYLIPKFHLPAHIPSCHVKYSFNKTPYVGLTNREAPEHGWSRLNQLAASLKVMGPGGYLDTLDNHIGDYNYRKSALMGSTLLKGILEAIPARTLHSAVYAEFTASLPKQDVQCWSEAIEAWERDPVNAVNPFETTVAFHLTLAQEEATEIAKIAAHEIQEHDKGAQEVNEDMAESTAKSADFTEENSEDIFVVRHEVRPSTMILQGVELESDQ